MTKRKASPLRAQQVNRPPPYAFWPLNPQFPFPFVFPEFGGAGWLAHSIGLQSSDELVYIRKLPDLLLVKLPNCDSEAAKQAIERGCPLRWPIFWSWIYRVPAPASPNLSNYTIRNPGWWVETLLEADAFRRDINSWAMARTVREFEELHKPRGENICHSKFAEPLCRRFHAYQRVRYRWHEYMMEKHCERCLGRAAAQNPTTPPAARACLIGWLSRQRGFSKHRLVGAFQRALTRKRPSVSLAEQKVYQAERQVQSKRPWRADPDEIGWLILASPIWESYGWTRTQIDHVLRLKFRSPDFHGRDREEFFAVVRSASQLGLPADRLLSPHQLGQSVPADWVLKFLAGMKESEEEQEWMEQQRRDSKQNDATERRINRLGLGLPRRRAGRPSNENASQKPKLFSLAWRITA